MMKWESATALYGQDEATQTHMVFVMTPTETFVLTASLMASVAKKLSDDDMRLFFKSTPPSEMLTTLKSTFERLRTPS